MNKVQRDTMPETCSRKKGERGTEGRGNHGSKGRMPWHVLMEKVPSDIYPITNLRATFKHEERRVIL